MKQLYRNILKFFLPLLFVLYLGGISLFTHYHVVNGVAIVHSHPFSDDSQHTHSMSEFLIIHLLSHLQVADGAVSIFLLSICLVLVYQLFYKIIHTLCHSFSCGVLSLRGPPVFLN